LATIFLTLCQINNNNNWFYSAPGHELVPADLARAIHVEEVESQGDAAEPASMVIYMGC